MLDGILGFMKQMSVRDEIVTRGFLTDTLADFREDLIDQIDVRMDKKLDKVDNKIDKVMIGIDGVMKELSDMREENAAGVLHSRRVDERIENHEKRIKKIESSKPLRN